MSILLRVRDMYGTCMLLLGISGESASSPGWPQDWYSYTCRRFKPTPAFSKALRVESPLEKTLY